ncbi:MAG: serine hydrolase [Lachnospiraceae bacterium]|nr:serine hydrolase [Lachnospiraceae bacterium]
MIKNLKNIHIEKKHIPILVCFSLLLLCIVFIMSGLYYSKNTSTQEVMTEQALVTNSGWVTEGGKTYYYNPDTHQKHTGWLVEGEDKYYFSPQTHAMVKGLLKLSDKEWFYFDQDGRMYRDCTVDNYVIHKSGLITKKIMSDEKRQLHQEQLQQAVDSISASYGADGVSVAVIENGAVTDTFQYGYAVKPNTPMTDDTKIRIASISKVVLSMIGFSMRDTGVVTLESSIGDYWGFEIKNPSYPNHTISLSNIFTHTSSISDLGSYQGIEDKLRRNIVFRNTQPSHPASCSYCNFAFAVAGATLEKAGGKVIDDLADEAFFNHLGVDASFISGKLKDTSLLAQLYYADGSTGRDVGYLSSYKGSNTPGENGTSVVGSLCISAQDMAKLVCILANNGAYEGTRYLTPKSVREMETPYCETDYHGVKVKQCMPLKYNTNIYGEKELYFHTGSAYGVYSLFTYNPKTRNGVVVITTGASGAQDQYGIYAICGDISNAIYSALRNADTSYDQNLVLAK